MKKLFIASIVSLPLLAPTLSFAEQPLPSSNGQTIQQNLPPAPKQRALEDNKNLQHKRHKRQTKAQKITENLNTQELNKITTINNTSTNKK